MSFIGFLHESRNNSNKKLNIWYGGGKVVNIPHNLFVLRFNLKFIPFFWFELQVIFHLSGEDYILSYQNMLNNSPMYFYDMNMYFGFWFTSIPK